MHVRNKSTRKPRMLFPSELFCFPVSLPLKQVQRILRMVNGGESPTTCGDFLSGTPKSSILKGCSNIINGNFRILKWRYFRTICLAIFCGDIPLHRPYIGLIYGRYLQFRFLKWPLRYLCMTLRCLLIGTHRLVQDDADQVPGEQLNFVRTNVATCIAFMDKKSFH